MDNKITSLHSTFSINSEISNDDTRFLNVTIDVMHTGLNLNDSVFEKDVVDSCIDSIKNTAVLGFIKYDKLSDSMDFKGHEHILTRTKNGVEEKYIGSAYGVIPESCNPRWITKVCPDGQEREFMQVDALLWTKFEDAVDILERDIEKSQSMELEISSVEGYEDEDGIFHFTKFRFDGCCILGDGVEPAMNGANVTIKEVQFAANDFVKNIQSELNDKFSIFTKLVNEKTNQGGMEIMPNTDFAQTVMQQFSDISAIVEQYETMTDKWGYTYPRYYLADIQENEAVVVDRKNSYHYYGFSFTVNGDKPEIDFTNAVRKKLQYVNYEEESSAPEGAFDFGKHIEEIENVAFEKVEEANKKVETAEQLKSEAETNYSNIKTAYDEIEPKYNEYVQMEEKRQAEELNAQKDAKFAEYEDVLADNAEFATLKERKEEMSIDEIEKECAVLYVRVNRPKASFSKVNNAPAIVSVVEEDDCAANGYVATKYGNIRVGQ